MNSMFVGAKNLILNATDIPELSQVTDVSQMFRRNLILVDNGGKIDEWNVSNVTNFAFMFQRAENFNADISVWNTEKATRMNNMFDGALKFNQPIGKWNVQNVTNMNEMLPFTPAFDQDLSAWNVEKLTTAETFLNNNSKLSNEHYDKLLTAWSKQSVQSGVKL